MKEYPELSAGHRIEIETSRCLVHSQQERVLHPCLKKNLSLFNINEGGSYQFLADRMLASC